MKEALRQPAVAGAFYPRHPDSLQQELNGLVPAVEHRHRLLACIAPHAGYVYSGAVAGQLFGHLDLPERIVVMGPNHTGMGAAVAVAPHSEWDTPLGPQPVDRDLAHRLEQRFPAASQDASAHWKEHSIEVQLPFLRQRRPELRVLPICIQHLGLEDCLLLGHALADVVTELGEPVGIVASSDMTHYKPDEVARAQDRKAIDAALARSPTELYETVHREGITMCGVVPATIALEAANRLGATDAHLVAYATSGDTSGDYSAVVGYAGICIHA
jgi:AmmeMemoRadiSam system protein B